MQRNHKGASLNSLKISEMSLTILSFMHVLCRRADLVKKKHFPRYDHPHTLKADPCKKNMRFQKYSDSCGRRGASVQLSSINSLMFSILLSDHTPIHSFFAIF